MSNKKLAISTFFIIFFMIFTHYSGISTGEFWNDPLGNVLKGLLMSFGILLLPSVILMGLINRTSIHTAVLAALSVEVFLAGLLIILGYPEYSKDFVKSFLVGLPIGLILSWIVAHDMS